MDANTQMNIPPQLSHNIVMLPPPSLLGHLIPFIEFAKKLVLQYNFSITLIIPNDGNSSIINSQKALLDQADPAINYTFLPPVSLDDLPEDVKFETRMSTSIIRSLPHLRSELEELKRSYNILTLVVDLFCSFALDVAKEFGVHMYIFYIVSATVTSLFLRELPSNMFDEGGEPKPVQLPGSLVLHGADIPKTMLDKFGDAHESLCRIFDKYKFAKGFIVNSFLELEPDAFKALEQEACRRSSAISVYSVGPLIQSYSSVDDGKYSKCFEWLNQQPPKSVIYISFGSGAALSEEQFTELAFGLEMSEQRFLWVARTPQENILSAYLKLNNNNNNNQRADNRRSPFDYLPLGFLERTKERGLVVDTWVPQVQILGHGSIAGFMTQSGWNAVLESVANGVPIISWPLAFEQRITAVFLANGLEVALRVKANENGIVERKQISNLVNELIVGEKGKQLQDRMTHLKISSAKALNPDGSSTNSLSQLVQKWISS